MAHLASLRVRGGTPYFRTFFSPLNPNVFAGTILPPKPYIFRNRVFTIVKLQFLKVRERKTRILNNFLNSIHCFGTFFLATFMDFYLIYFVVVSQNVVFLVLEPLGADFELPSGPCHPRGPSIYDGKKYMLSLIHI